MHLASLPFFPEKITCIRSEIDVAVVAQEFFVDFLLRFTRPSNLSHFRSVTEANFLRYMRETRKTCSLDPINVSKLDGAYESAASAVNAITNSFFDEGHFLASEKHGLNSALPQEDRTRCKRFFQLPSCNEFVPPFQDPEAGYA